MPRQSRHLVSASLWVVVLPVVIAACSSAAPPYSSGSNDGAAGSGGAGAGGEGGSKNIAGSDNNEPSEGGTAGAGGDGGAAPSGSCCEVHDSAGCETKNVMDCVCSSLPACCTGKWTAECVEHAAKTCTTCAGGGEGGAGGSAGSAGSGQAGAAPFGGNGGNAGSGQAGAAPFGGNGGNAGSGDSEPFGGSSGTTPGGTCCNENYYPGCSSTVVEACVCDEDPYCCLYEWDSDCVDAVTLLDCGTCSGSGGSSSCCNPYGGYCGDAYIKECVCQYDYACCVYGWDDVCASEVEMLGCGSCG